MTRKEARTSRETARANGEKLYQGRPCKRAGHTERYVSTGQCVVCCREANVAWRPAHAAQKQETERVWRCTNPKKYLLKAARTRAKRFGLEFSITEDDLVWPEYCPVFGYRLKYGTARGEDPASASIDRIDNSKGYIPGNVRVISRRANELKRDATPEELQLLADDANRCVKSNLRLLA